VQLQVELQSEMQVEVQLRVAVVEVDVAVEVEVEVSSHWWSGVKGEEQLEQGVNSSLVVLREGEASASSLGFPSRRFSRGAGVLGVSRVTWHLPSPVPGAGCPRQGRPHLLQLREEGTSSSTEAMEVEERGEEGVEGAWAA